MAPTSRAVKTEIENVLTYLVESEIALHANPVVVDRLGRVTWRSGRPAGKLVSSWDSPSALDYRRWLDTGAYSAFLADGSLLQLTYEFDGTDLVGHRLAYVPCPFNLDRSDLVLDPFVDVFDVYASGATTDVVLQSVIRFDFAPVDALPGHPTVHMTINSPECRVPCVAPLSVGRFIGFVFNNFYPALLQLHPYLTSVSGSWRTAKSIDPQEQREIHVAWQV